ncbi:MAG: glycosyltransferase family 4 protein [Acidobacteria bacterium]|nr:glycosyltransferase family 4 protein [Acidobacteriota bacterium]
MQVRILHIVGDSKFGGAALAILRLARFWQTLNWEVEVLATDPEFCRAASTWNVKVVPFDAIWRPVRPWRDLKGLLRLVRFLRARNYTVVHTHTSKAGFIGRLAARMAGVPVVVHTAHGFAFHEASPWWTVAFYVALERIASWCCRRVIAVSRFHQDWGRDLGIAPAHKIVAIPNGTPAPPESSPGEVEQIRQGCGAGPEDLVLVTPGRLAPQKGLEDLLEAARLLRARTDRRLLFLVAGEGPLRTALEEAATAKGLGDCVRFLGFQSNVHVLLAAADIVVLPSWREGLSIALLEAMAKASAIVTTSIGSNREATGEGKAALLVPPGQPRLLADAILLLAADPDLRQRLGRQARALYCQRHTLERMLAGYQQIYLELLKETHRAQPVSSVLSSANR